MQLNPSTTEQVTAATNLPLAVVCLAAVNCLWCRRHAHPLRAWLWIGMFGGLAIATSVGILVHGLALEAAGKKLVWHPINAALGLTVACFVAGAALDRWGPAAARRTLGTMLLLSAGFFCYATFWASSFLPFILYEGVAMVFCLAVYLTLAAQGRLRGTGWIVVGIGITILAAVLQAMPRLKLQIGVTFDHNGIFHLVQLPGLMCLLAGVNKGLATEPEETSNPAGVFPRTASSS